MKYRLLTQSPASESEETLIDVLSEIIHSLKCDQVYVGTAYATVGGVRKLLTAMIEGTDSFESSWLFGLDDYITQPGAMELCNSLPASNLRVASLSKQHRSKFHPKIFLLSTSYEPWRSALVVGSSNLTARGLSKNAEASMVLFSETRDEYAELHAYWQEYWRLGRPISEEMLKAYQEKYQEIKTKRESSGLADQVVELGGEPDRKKRVLRKRVSSKGTRGTGILEKDEAEIDPSVASTCWIEVGNITGKGVELELTAEQALFFDLSPHGGKSEYRKFVLSDGTQTSLKLKYQENGMWRLQMSRIVPEVAVGLRPRSVTGKLLRSPYVAVFSKLPDATYELRFIDEDSDEYSELAEESRQFGTFGSTSARNYGWL